MTSFFFVEEKSKNRENVCKSILPVFCLSLTGKGTHGENWFFVQFKEETVFKWFVWVGGGK